MTPEEVTAYLETQGVEKELAECVNQVCREKAPNALARLSELLAAKVGKPVAPPLCEYLDTVGNTPLVKLSKCLPEGVKAARVLAKLEMCNPGGSLKDRIALQMIEKAEKEGTIKPGVTTLVDFTSGNTGIGEAMVAAAKGYKCIIVMPQVPPMFERYIICRQFGAEVRLLNPAAGGVAWVNYCKELCKEPNHWYIGQARGRSPRTSRRADAPCPRHDTRAVTAALRQMENMNNPEAHIENTGPEIWAQTGGQIDYFVHGIGTGGCIAGVGKYLKEKNPDVKVVALEPSEARVHTGAPMGKHGIVGCAGSGLRQPTTGPSKLLLTSFAPAPRPRLLPCPCSWMPGFHSNFLEGVGKPAAELSDAPRGVVDEWGHVSTPECVEWATKVTKEEGMMVGPCTPTRGQDPAIASSAFSTWCAPHACSPRIGTAAGAAIKYACEVACRPEAAGKTIVVVVPSHGIRYVQHPLWGKMKAEAGAALPSPPCSDKEAAILQWDSANPPPAKE